MRKVLCSGGFDPLHVGHLRYLVAAAKYGSVTVAVNSDAWLIRKKGYVFMSWNQRAEIIRGLHCILGTVHQVIDDNETVCEALQQVRPDIFANGGDRTEAIPAEHAFCKALGIEELFNVGGDKIASSSRLVKAASLMHQYRNIKHVSFS